MAVWIPLLALGQIFDWSDEALGLPMLAIVGYLTVLQVQMREREGGSRRRRSTPRG